MYGLITGFLEDEILGEKDHMKVLRLACSKAVELAMLGMKEEAHSIFTLLSRHGKPPSIPTYQDKPIAVTFFYAAAGLQRPGTPSQPQDSEIREMQLYVLNEYLNNDAAGSGLSTVTEQEAYDRLVQVLETTQGYTYTAPAHRLRCFYLALRLRHYEDAARHFKTIAASMRSYMGSEHLGLVYEAWTEYLLPGQLRQELGLEEEDLRTYSNFVFSVTKTRLEDGRQRPDIIYKDYTMRQLLEDLDANTHADPHWEPSDESESEDGAERVLRSPATEEEIAAAEERVGSPLPEELKDLLRISNGLGPVTVQAGFRENVIVTANEIFREEDPFMSDYSFKLLPTSDLEADVVEFDWPGITPNQIALYSGDGRAVGYIWIMKPDTECILQARKVIQDTYEMADESIKAVIDRKIAEQYGSRKAYDNMTIAGWVIYRQPWGQPCGQEIFLSYISFVRDVVYRSRVRIEKSPLAREAKALPGREV